MVQEESSPGSKSGDEVPQKLKLFAHLHGFAPNILKNMVMGIRNACSDV